MRRIIAGIITVFIFCTNLICQVFAENKPDYSLEAAEQFSSLWNNYYRQNETDIYCGYLCTEDDSDIDSFFIAYNNDMVEKEYISGIFPKTTCLGFAYEPQSAFFAFFLFSDNLKSDLENIVIYTDDGVINNAETENDHDSSGDMWSIVFDWDDAEKLLDYDHFIVKFTINGKDEFIEISKDKFSYLYDMFTWISYVRVYTDKNNKEYYSAGLLPGGTRNTPVPEVTVNDKYSFQEDIIALNQKARSVFYVEMYDKKDNWLGNASGFVSFDEHLFITNQHVIENASYLIIWDEEDKAYTLDKVVSSDKTHDIAILLFPGGRGYDSLELNTNDELMRGQRVVTIGCPEGFQGTIANGNISALPVLEKYGGLRCIQFTAPISHGSSGGALFDDNGKVIGITSAGVDEGHNLNFAIPIQAVQELYEQWNKKDYELLGSKRSWNMTGITPSPVPTSTPTPKPTSTPRPISTSTVTPTPTHKPESGHVIQGNILNRYAVTTQIANLRSVPDESDQLIKILSKKQYVYMLWEEVNSKNEKWTKVIVNGKEGYIRSEYLKPLSKEESAAYDTAQPSPAPVYTVEDKNALNQSQSPTISPIPASSSTPIW